MVIAAATASICRHEGAHLGGRFARVRVCRKGSDAFQGTLTDGVGFVPEAAPPCSVGGQSRKQDFIRWQCGAKGGAYSARLGRGSGLVEGGSFVRDGGNWVFIPGIQYSLANT